MISLYLALLENPEDESRFIEFYNKFYSTVYLIAKDHLRTREAAEDCAQEIMLRFAKDFHNINQDFNDKRFRNYVRIVAKGISVDMYRKEKKHLENVVEDDISEFKNLSIEEFDRCDIFLLEQAVSAMPEEYRYVFYLKYFYQYSGKEISQKTGITETTVRQKCMHGMHFVRNYIKEAENNE
ncbi:MAG: sigma-70 family RNA polymerase sigma factor [Clostridia bacterium]|nr:sigma-70 family RNA polymerase sigma factor [Clostridia bacterium]